MPCIPVFLTPGARFCRRSSYPNEGGFLLRQDSRGERRETKFRIPVYETPDHPPGLSPYAVCGIRHVRGASQVSRLEIHPRPGLRGSQNHESIGQILVDLFDYLYLAFYIQNDIKCNHTTLMDLFDMFDMFNCFSLDCRVVANVSTPGFPQITPPTHFKHDNLRSDAVLTHTSASVLLLITPQTPSTCRCPTVLSQSALYHV